MTGPGKGARVATLLVVLSVVALWAVGRTNTRRARSAWDRPVSVAVLVLSPDDASAAAEGGAAGGLAGLQDSLEALARRMTEEWRRHDPTSEGPAFTFEVVGPLRPERLPPTDPPEPGQLARVVHAWDLWRATRAAHQAAPGFLPAAWDIRVYLVATPGAARFAEGLGESGGEVGIVRASLGGGDALLAATAVLHEALHCLGASDKYDQAGHALLPAGLVEPERAPAFPQARAEIMVGEVPLAPGQGRLPARADEVGVGPATAAEIGWRVAPR